MKCRAIRGIIGAVAISFNDTRYSINRNTVLDDIVCIWLNATVPYLHDKPVIKRGAAKRCAGTFRAFGRKHYNECLCTRQKGGEAGFRKAIGKGNHCSFEFSLAGKALLWYLFLLRR